MPFNAEEIESSLAVGMEKVGLLPPSVDIGWASVCSSIMHATASASNDKDDNAREDCPGGGGTSFPMSLVIGSFIRKTGKES
jgi:hypothetical protein